MKVGDQYIIIDANNYPAIARTFEKHRGYLRREMGCGHGSFVHTPSLTADSVAGFRCKACREATKMHAQEIAEEEAERLVAEMGETWESGGGVAVGVTASTRTVCRGSFNSIVGRIVSTESAFHPDFAVSVVRMLVEDNAGRRWQAMVPRDLLLPTLSLTFTAMLMPDNPNAVRKLPKTTKPAKPKTLRAGKVVAVVPKRGTKAKQLPSRSKVT